MAVKQILCDANIWIDFYKDDPGIIGNLKAIGQDNLAINTVILAELIQGARNKKEANKILADARSINMYKIDTQISDICIDLLCSYSLSHGLRVADAIIAATALYHNIELYTLNIKDFKFIKNLNLYKPLNPQVNVNNNVEKSVKLML